MPKALPLALIAGLSSALLSVFVFGPAPIVAAGLGLGAAWAQIAAALAAMGIVLAGGTINLLSYLATIGIPAIIIVQTAFASAARAPDGLPSPGRILANLSLFGLAIILFLASDMFGLGGRIEAQIEELFQGFFKQIQESGGVTDVERSRKAIEALSRFAASIAPGGLAAATMIIVTINGVITQSLLRQAEKSMIGQPDYTALELPKWLGLVAILALVLAFFPGMPGKLGLNAVIFLSIPFLLTGLAVIHTLSRRAGNPKAVLAAFYILLVLISVLVGLFGHIMGLLAVVGLLEQWAGLRRRFGARPGDDLEDE